MGRLVIFEGSWRRLGRRLQYLDPLGHPPERSPQPIQIVGLFGDDVVERIVIALVMSQGGF